MRGGIPPHLQHAFMAWCSVKKSTGTPFFAYLITCRFIMLHLRTPQLCNMNTNLRFMWDLRSWLWGFRSWSSGLWRRVVI